ncbi:MAG: hypothetical protein ABIR11_05305 [Candidatus Limnocylindrales bacterium]
MKLCTVCGAYLARLKALREARDAVADGSGVGVPAQRAIEWLRALAESVQQADVPKEKADLMHAIYERITVAGPEIVSVRLTQAAYAHGLALALPEKVAMARPTGVARADPYKSKSRSRWQGIGPGRRGQISAQSRLPSTREKSAWAPIGAARAVSLLSISRRAAGSSVRASSRRPPLRA